MEIMETIWPIVGIPVPLLYTGAGVMVSIPSQDYRVARALFIGSAVILATTDLVWKLTTDKPTWFRISAGISVAIAAFVITPILVSWTRKRQGRSRSEDASQHSS
jgi:hypothetical protein